MAIRPRPGLRNRAARPAGHLALGLAVLIAGLLAVPGVVHGPGSGETPRPSVPSRAVGPTSSLHPAGNGTDWGAAAYSWIAADNRTVANASTVPDGHAPSDMAYDPVQGSLWVGFGADSVGEYFVGNVTPELIVVNTTTDRIETIFTAYTVVTSVVYDPAAREMYATVLSLDLNRSTTDGEAVVFNASTDAVVDPGVPVGMLPMGMVYVPATRDVWVANEGSDTVTVISGTSNQVLYSVSSYDLISPWGMAYDPVNGDVYVACFFGSAVVPVNATTGIVLGFEIPTPGEYAFVQYDSVSGLLYTYALGGWSYNSGLGIIDPATQSEIAIAALPGGTLPDSLVVVPGTGNLWLGLDSGVAVEFDVANDSVLPGSLPVGSEPWSAAVDPASGEAYFGDFAASDLVPVNVERGVEDRSPVSLGADPVAAAWDPDDGRVYITDAGLPGLISFNLTSEHATGAWEPLGHLALGSTAALLPGPIAYVPTRNELLVASNTSGSLWVVNASTGAVEPATIDVGSNVTALAFDPANGLVYLGAANDTLLALDPSTDLVRPVVPLDAAPGALVIDPDTGWVWAVEDTGLCTGALEAVNPANGSLAINTTWGFRFFEPALDPVSDILYVPTRNFCGGGNFVLAVDAQNGTSVAGPPTFLPEATAFDPVNDGLYVAEGDVAVFNGTTVASATTAGPVLAGNGPLYLFAVPTTGTVLALGAKDGTVEGITLAPTIVSATATPSTVDLGMPVAVSVAVGGAAGNVTYDYAGLPAGCAPADASNFTCTPSGAGNATVTVTAVDAADQTVTATFAIDVRPLPALDLVASPSAVLVGVPVGLSAHVVGGVPPFNISWQFGDGTGGAGVSLHHTYAAPGTFRVTGTVRDRYGRTGDGATNVTVGETLAATAVVAPLSVRIGTTVYVNATADAGEGPYQVAVEFGDGVRATGSTPTAGTPVELPHVYAATGTFPVTIWVNDSAGGSEQFDYSVTVSAAPSPPAAHAGVTATEYEAGLGAADGAAAVALAVVLLRGRRRRGATVPPAPPAPP